MIFHTRRQIGKIANGAVPSKIRIRRTFSPSDNVDTIVFCVCVVFVIRIFIPFGTIAVCCVRTTVLYTVCSLLSVLLSEPFMHRL